MPLILPSEIARIAAEAGGKTHAEAMKILKRENPDWPEGDLADAANSVSPSMGSDARKVQKRYQALTKTALSFKPGDLVQPGLGAVGHVSMDGPKRPSKKLPLNATGTVQEGSPKAGFIPVKFDKLGILWVNVGSIIPAKTASSESPMILPSELARLGKFPAGVSMTIDEVAAVVGDEFKQMNIDPPPEVVALREEMMDKTARFPDIPEIEVLKVGYRVRLRNGARGEIIRVFGNAFSPSYTVELSDGRAVKCGPEDILHHSRFARFEEGPEGAKQFDAWMAKQPQEVQDDWKKYTEENGDKFKTAAGIPALTKSVELIGDLNEMWGPVVREYKGTPDSREVARLAQIIEDLELAIVNLSLSDSKTARYEEGQPADPTAEMSPEDAAEWRGNTEKYKDKFTDEESMMDKFQGQLLPSESFALMASADSRRRSTWKAAEIEDTIGEKVKGPEEADKDEAYMKGQFTQEENSELSGKVAKGQKIYGHLEWLE